VEIKNSDIGSAPRCHTVYAATGPREGTKRGRRGRSQANYDGERKHPRRTARRHSWESTPCWGPRSVGTGLTRRRIVITKDVPHGALGIARETSAQIRGHTDRRKAREALPMVSHPGNSRVPMART